MTPESAQSEGTILIIDDSPYNLRVLSKTLFIHQYTVRCATSGAMALLSVQTAPPDLILLDIRMPDMDGYEICQQLKQNAATQDIPVVFLSALDAVTDIVEAFRVGGVDYITKPFQTDEVLARIRNQLTIQKLKKQLFDQNQHLCQEINERKKFEQALCQEIQQRILIEASLQDAKNAAEAANYVKSGFLAQMSHELRTPLNAILGFTTLMQQETSLITYQQYVGAIDENARQLLKLVNNILAVTRTELSQLALDEQEFNLHYLFNSIVSFWQPKALEKGLKLQFQQAAEVPQYIRSDESKLRQILMNLLDHAIQVADKGSVIVRVGIEDRLSSSSSRTCSLIIEVQNTETEIALNDLNHVFQIFTQPHQKLTQELGFNLLLIRQFAQLMGGDAIFKSYSEQGSIIYVHILVQLSESLFSQLHSGSSTCVAQSMPDESVLGIETLQLIMPDDWLEQLHQAAVKGFDHQILHLLQKVPASHASFAKILEVWARSFQFDRILTVMQDVMQ